MKKLMLVIIATLLILNLTACGNNNDDDTYKVGDRVGFGQYWWTVLDVDDEENRVLLLSEKIVTRRAYHTSKTKITWADCELRKYLNSVFIEESFNATEEKLIVETTIDNTDNQTFGTAGGTETTDKVFLLSLDEVVEYFGDSGELYGRPDKKPGEVWTPEDSFIDDEYNDNRMAEELDGTDWYWCLRSPGKFDFYAAEISADGILWLEGLSVNASEWGVRPALWMKIE
ncbi:MAG: DUF6273 domain-containing protein [Eubacteriales bacterium]